MYLVEVYNKNTGVQTQYFAETWTKLITIFNLVVDINTQKEYTKTVRRREGTIKYCSITCDNFRINVHEIQDFNEFYESDGPKTYGETISNSQEANEIFANKISIGYLSDSEGSLSFENVAKIASPTADCDGFCYNSDKVVKIASPTGINMEKFGKCKCQEDC